MKPIAHIHTDLPQKFGIPRNSFLAPHLQGRIVFEPEYALNSAVAGIDSFSHLWLLWRFENGEPGGGAADVAGARTAAATGAGPIIHVLGADLRDGTPIYDIKPYIPFADCHPDACGGWIEDAPWHELDVDFPEQLQAEVPAGKLAGLAEVLRQDPRRAGSKHEPTRVYHLAYADLDVAFTVDGDVLHVVCVS